MTTASPHIPSGHASFWEDVRWWIEQTINVYGEPAELAGRSERRSAVNRLRGWLCEIECLVRRLVIAAALALDLPPPERARLPAKPRAGADAEPASPAEPKPEKPEPEKSRPLRLTFLPATRKDGASSQRSSAPRPFDWDAAYARHLSVPSARPNDARSFNERMIGFRADLRKPLDRRRREPDDAFASQSRTRFSLAGYAMHLRHAGSQSALASMDRCGRKLEALMHVLADPVSAILSTARRMAARPDDVAAFSGDVPNVKKPQILADALRATVSLVADALRQWTRRPSASQPDPREEPG